MKTYSKLLFIHIPKCAGTSVVRSLINWFDPNEICQVPPTTRLHIDPLPQLRSAALHGHVPFSLGRLIKDERMIFTVLRDPIDRTLSAYWYLREKENHPLHSEFVKEVGSIDDFISSCSFKFHSCNMQTRLLGASDDWAMWLAASWAGGHWTQARAPWQVLMDEPLDECLDRALQRIQQPNVVVGIQTALPRALDNLADKLGVDRLSSVPSLNTRNERSYRSIETLQQEAIDTIAHFNAFDMILYKSIKTLTLEPYTSHEVG